MKPCFARHGLYIFRGVQLSDTVKARLKFRRASGLETIQLTRIQSERQRGEPNRMECNLLISLLTASQVEVLAANWGG